MKKVNIILTAVVCVLALVYSCRKEDEAPAKQCTPPSAPVASNNSPVKVGDAINLTAQEIANATYNWWWKKPNGVVVSLSNQRNFSFTFEKDPNGNFYKEGDYYVTATVGGCTSEAYHTYVTSAEISAGKDTTLNSGGTLRLNASNIKNALGNIVPATYNWTGPNGFTSNKQNASISNISLAAAGDYVVTATLSNGVQSQPATVKVSIGFGAPSSQISLNPASGVKVGESLTLDINVPNADSYSWTGPNGFSSNQKSPVINNITRAAAGTYTVTYTISGIQSAPGVSKAVVVGFSDAGCGGDTVVTFDGKTYKVVEIAGQQCWMKENLQRNSSPLFSWTEANIAADGSNVAQQGACPTGWHLPSDSMWIKLLVTVANDGNALKDTTEGVAPNKGTNTSGFTAKLGLGTGTNKFAAFWSSDAVPSSNSAKNLKLFWGNNLAPIESNDKATVKYYIRCLKD